jgi:hypothetical protein
MFNEILTGKASIEPQPAVADPYRQESVPDVSKTCVDCQQTFTTKITNPVTRCQRCHLTLVEANAAASARAYAETEAQLSRERTHAWIRRAVLILICGTIVAFIKYEMRKQYAEDMRAANGGLSYSNEHYYDPYVSQTRGYADHMCFCEDLKCARDVQREYTLWSRNTTDRPENDDAAAAASVELERLGNCLAKHEQ